MLKETLKPVISEEIALNELESFINFWAEKPESKDKLQETYPYMYENLMSGNLIINDEKVPTYKLKHPVKNENGDISKTDVDFKTRITPTTQARLGKGLSIQTDQLQFGIVCIAHIIGEPLNMLDKFSKKDYNSIREIAQVFL